ncbi:probable rhamnogalacturonate lyase B isoform X2 [Durio zibethinus]|uniref:rhamnogalacturonan endolyase n=1 Tax=Durio zibethinus TaxID=66656 RepID=A0A6P6B767_DURZI|nr:probable rhamnogalacturonate lyase B isoform X2 [Durio zibethinus]
MSIQGVQLYIQDDHVMMENGILRVTISKPERIVTGVSYQGIENLLEVRNEESDRGYWDLVWSEEGTAGTTGTSYVIKGAKFRVIVENEEQVEISFTRAWSSSLEGKHVPLSIDKRFVMLRGSSGFYSYAIYEHLKEWPGFNLPQTRIVFKLRKDKFRYMAVADNRQRRMPLPEDRLPRRSRPLAYPEAVLLVHPVEPEFKGEVDDKYQYSCDNKDLYVHGWICSDPPVGWWQITPSNEFRSGGPMKQNLTSHVGPTNLAMFLSAHYVGEDMVLKFKRGEPWKKVFGPVFIYLNTLIDNDDPLWLWEDAKEQMLTEVQSWPYNFPASEDFPKSEQRGCVSGRLQVSDRHVSDDNISTNGAYVGLAPPGDVGSWQTESKGYQFWTRTDADGYFLISDVRNGDYNLYAWVPGFIGDYKNNAIVTITPGCDIDMGNLVYEPPRDGPTLWEIGIPDRTAAEFYVPDPDPMYINKLYVNHPDRFRQYGLWEKYSDLYPNGDLVYTVAVSDYRTDWFFAQVTRKKDEDKYEGTTWQIKFNLENVNQTGTYKLRVALATAYVAELQVRINNPKANPPLFTTGVIGHDNTITRHGIHGLYRLYSIDAKGALLMEGENTIFLTQPMCSSALQGLMYDYIRLEAPPSNNSTKKH